MYYVYISDNIEREGNGQNNNKKIITSLLLRLEKELKKERKQKEKFKKRCQRQKKRHKSPRSKINLELRSSPTVLRKRLLFHAALTNDRRARYQNATGEKERQMIEKICAGGKIIRKYRLRKYAEAALGFSKKRWRMSNKEPLAFQRKGNARIGETIKTSVRQYFERDDVSRLTTGKKQTKTKSKLKKQKQFLLDTLRNAHRKFLAEYPERIISYSLFCHLQPFWVVSPSLADRETCLCKTHENLTFIVNKLHQHRLVSHCNLEELVKEIMCDSQRKECMYGECETCKLTNFPVKAPYTPETMVSYVQWGMEERQRSEGGESVAFKITVKKVMESTLGDLVEKFNDQLVKFKRHNFNISKQFAFIRALKAELSDNECIIHIDFSENYACKWSSEIQAAQFGGSHQQAILHTGVLYTAPNATPTCFCTVTSSRQKGPAAIWEHLRPVLTYVKQKHPTVKVLHFLSDGPCSQYRQRGNFFLFCTELHKWGFTQGTWNYFEASHGKGAPDGVGGALKRQADGLVSKGHDITDARSLYSALIRAHTTIKLFYVDEDDIEQAVQAMPQNIPTVPSTMHLHQVVTLERGSLICRDVSCTCVAMKGLQCQCPGSQAFSFLPDNQTPIQDNTVDWTNSEVIGKWCVVKYGDDLYPGTVMATDDSYVQVKCMHSRGPNRFSWPIRDDVLWFLLDDVLRLIPAPLPVTAHHVEIQRDVWLELTK